MKLLSILPLFHTPHSQRSHCYYLSSEGIQQCLLTVTLCPYHLQHLPCSNCSLIVDSPSIMGPFQSDMQDLFKVALLKSHSDSPQNEEEKVSSSHRFFSPMHPLCHCFCLSCSTFSQHTHTHHMHVHAYAHTHMDTQNEREK